MDVVIDVNVYLKLSFKFLWAVLALCRANTTIFLKIVLSVLKMAKFQLKEKTGSAAVFCDWNDTTCFSVCEREREERDWGKTALSFGDEIEREYCWTRRSHSHSCCKYDFLCNKISFGRLQFGKFENNILLNLFFICLQQFVEEKMVGMMKNIPLCFSFLDLQGLVNLLSWNKDSVCTFEFTHIKHGQSDITLLMTVTLLRFSYNRFLELCIWKS